MIPTAGLSDSIMIAAAHRRALVVLASGRGARLVGWRVRGGAGRARVEMQAGVMRTVKCAEVVALAENLPAEC